MDNFTPRPTLPDAWAEKSHCPICGMIPLWVLHQQNAPDEMNCPRCGTAFRVERAGRHLYLTQTPPGYQHPVGEQWLPAKVIRAYAKQHPWNPTSPPPGEPDMPAGDIQTAPLSQPPEAAKPAEQSEPIPAFLPDSTPDVSPELVAKAKELHELGNSRTKIRTILMETEDISLEEIEDVLTVALQETEEKNKRQNRTVLIAGGILVLLCICSVIAVLLIRSLTSSVTPIIGPEINQPIATQPAPDNQENSGIPFLPDSVEQLMPLLSGEPPSFPTPQIVQGDPSGNKHVACPLDSDNAAKIFGGPASGWTMISDPPSWYFVSLIPETINIPQGMTGEIMILEDTNGSMKTVRGPATIKNTNMIFIACE